MEWYPLNFYPIYKEKIWGGNKLSTRLGRKDIPSENTGESFELTCFDDNISIISNGFLRNAPLNEIIKKFPEDVLGKKVYEKYGNDKFPLLFKYIDANKDLSIQVHPNEENVEQMKQGEAKTECWYIMESEGGKLNIGFKNTDITKEEIHKLINEGELETVLNYVVVHKDESYFIKSNTVHAICSNVFLAEIQQASDTTYRLYDYNRKDDKGNLRELHIDKGINCINPNYSMEKAKVEEKIISETESYKKFIITKNPYFTIEKWIIQGNIMESSKIDSFNVFMVVDGSAILLYREGEMRIYKGTTLLIPSAMGEYSIEGDCVLLNTYI